MIDIDLHHFAVNRIHEVDLHLHSKVTSTDWSSIRSCASTSTAAKELTEDIA